MKAIVPRNFKQLKPSDQKKLMSLADECIIGIDSNLQYMRTNNVRDEFWHHCSGKKIACQGLLDVVREIEKEYGLESEEAE